MCRIFPFGQTDHIVGDVTDIAVIEDPAGTDPARVKDRLSASYLVALAGRVVRDDEGAPHGRWYRVVAMSYPRPAKEVRHE